MNIRFEFEKYVLAKNNKVKISSKEIKSGDIFLALKGKNFHGNQFIKSSIRRGAKYCLTDNKNFEQNSKIIYVNNLINYLKDLANKKRDLYRGKVIGITGSAGKTTLKETLAFFLKKNEKISFSQKSYNNELGVLISLLNLNLKSKFSIFEIGTNNFGEIKNLTKIVKPTEIFITNIQSTHLQSFKSKDNIAKEKSDIFNSKYNNQQRRLFLNITSKSENIILQKAKKEKNLKLILINNIKTKYYIKKIMDKKKFHRIYFLINKKTIALDIKNPISFRLINLLFCLAFFDQNLLNTKVISKWQKYLKPVDGRGLIHSVSLNNKKIKVIDESYNSNPDTMLQSINYFANIKNEHSQKILILGNMNELGKNTYKLHFQLLHELDKSYFKFVILCGEFFRRSIINLDNPKNEFIYIENRNEIMKFLAKKIHNNDIILIKCSNSTEINKFAKNLLNKAV
tara:strand:- start:7117 stop:8481 length:1365 start_codon:yes stop_codon:yes gene_type:complete